MNAPKPSPVSSATQLIVTGLNEHAFDPPPLFARWKAWLTSWAQPKAQESAEERSKRARHALREGNLSDLGQLVRSGFPFSTDYPWLCIATRRQSLTLIQTLIDANVSLETKDHQTRGATGRSALHEASRRGWTEGVGVLLAAGASLESTDDLLQTPLHLASKKGKLEVVQQLLSAGANPNGHPSCPLRPLHSCASAAIALALIKAKVDPDQTSHRGEGALHVHVRAGRKDVVHALLAASADANLNAETTGGPLGEIASGPTTELLDVLLRHGADLSVLDANGSTPIHRMAAKCRDEAVFVAIHLKQPSVWALLDRSGRTPLDILADQGLMSLADKLAADARNQKETTIAPSLRNR